MIIRFVWLLGAVLALVSARATNNASTPAVPTTRPRPSNIGIPISTTSSTSNLGPSSQQPIWNETWTDRLKQHLLAKYDKFARPSQHWNTTTVSVKLNVQTVEVDDMVNVMAANVWVVMTWNDDKLKWNSSDYSGLKEVNLGAHEIWLPDIYLLNSASHGMEYYGDRHCIVNEDGTVLWVTPTIFHGYCHLDFTYWPFEMNTCRLSLSSWTYDGDQVDLKLLGSGVDVDDYVAINEWVMQNITASRREEVFDCCPEPYISLDFEFELSRSSELYYHIVFVPLVPIVFLSLITFWLRPQSEIKIVINACITLILVLYLMYFGYKVPARFDSIPLIVRFYSGCLYQTAISLIISTLVINMKKFAHYSRIPRSLRRFLLGKGGRYLGLGQIIQEIEVQKSAAEQEMCENHLMEISTSTTSFVSFNGSQQQLTSPQSNRAIASLEWQLMASAVDRIVFLGFCLIYLIMALGCVRFKRFTFSSDNFPYWHN